MSFRHTKIMGIVGEGIQHTLSPKIHEFSAQRLGLKCEYRVYDMPSYEVEAFLEKMWEDGASGFNVTMPHKRLVSKILASRGQTAVPESVNTLFRGEVWWEGASTDGVGFFRGLREIVHPETIKEAVFVGAGGAVESILSYWKESGVLPKVWVFARSRKEPIQGIPVQPLELEILKNILNGKSQDTLLIQATSAPIQGNDLKDFLPAIASFYGVISDLIYKTPSSWISFHRSRGLPAQDGFSMLIEQARASQELWWGRSVSESELGEVVSV